MLARAFVRQRVSDIFSELAERGRVRAYDPTDEGDTERALTEVAQGLVYSASDDAIERVVLWDVDLITSVGGRHIPVARRGDRYRITEDGVPELRQIIEIADGRTEGMAVGLFEAQLDHLYFLFGVADIPPTVGAVKAEIVLRPDSLYPVLRVLDADGCEVTRDPLITGWGADKDVVADMDRLEEGQV